jgi:hypothetical protein
MTSAETMVRTCEIARAALTLGCRRPERWSACVATSRSASRTRQVHLDLLNNVSTSADVLLMSIPYSVSQGGIDVCAKQIGHGSALFSTAAKDQGCSTGGLAGAHRCVRTALLTDCVQESPGPSDTLQADLIRSVPI